MAVDAGKGAGGTRGVALDDGMDAQARELASLAGGAQDAAATFGLVRRDDDDDDDDSEDDDEG